MKASMRQVIVLTIIAAASALVLSMVYNFTYDPIQRNRAAALEGSILAVLPGAVDFNVIEAELTERIDDDRSTVRSTPSSDSGPLMLYQGLDESGKAVGFAFVGEGAGYGGIVKIMVGVDHNTELISGLEVLEHAETPNLGSKIEDASFRNQFIGKGLNDPLTVGQDIDKVSGATVSSNAVTAAIKGQYALALEAYKEAVKNE